jgi:cytochrome c2
MRKPALLGLSSLLVGALLFGPAAPSAKAVKQFRDEFIAKYVKADSSVPKDKAFAAAVEAAKCNLCHMGTSKKDRNPYGKALDELLDRKTDKENKEKIRSALDKVAQMKAKPDDPNSSTFGQRLSEGKLPCSEEK